MLLCRPLERRFTLSCVTYDGIKCDIHLCENKSNWKQCLWKPQSGDLGHPGSKEEGQTTPIQHWSRLLPNDCTQLTYSLATFVTLSVWGAQSPSVHLCVLVFPLQMCWVDNVMEEQVNKHSCLIDRYEQGCIALLKSEGMKWWPHQPNQGLGAPPDSAHMIGERI